MESFLVENQEAEWRDRGVRNKLNGSGLMGGTLLPTSMLPSSVVAMFVGKRTPDEQWTQERVKESLAKADLDYLGHRLINTSLTR